VRTTHRTADEHRGSERRDPLKAPAFVRALTAAMPRLESVARSLSTRPGAARGSGSADTDPLPRLLSGLGLAAGFALAVVGRDALGGHGPAGAIVLAAALWVVVWSQVTAALLGRARLGWPRGMIPELFALLALAGLGVAGVLLYVASAAAAVPAATLGLRAGALLWLLGLASAVACNVILGWRFAVLARWIVRQRDALGPAAAYGAGLGLLSVMLAVRTGAAGITGASLLAALVLLSELALQALLAGMRTALRRHGVSHAYAERVRRWLLAYAAFFALAPGMFAAAGAVFPALSFTAATVGLDFALLGAMVALASLAMALRQGRQPATWVLLAGGLALLGLTPGLLMTAVYVAILARLLLLSHNVPRYAVLFL